MNGSSLAAPPQAAEASCCFLLLLALLWLLWLLMFASAGGQLRLVKSNKDPRAFASVSNLFIPVHAVLLLRLAAAGWRCLC